MSEKLTPQQREAVTNRGGKLLVSAAAGSGKTKVLVDRLLSYLTDPVAPANIDDFLIITYTKAAAAELRGKIASKLTERIAEEPENRHLQQQMQRLYLSKISTVHSFCADILREHAYRLDIAADFRVADENECLEYQLRVIQQILDEAYESAGMDPDFCAFVDSQGFGRDDRQIPEIILKVYHSAMCHLDPDQWLRWCLSSAADPSVTDAAQTVWGKYLLEDMHSYLDLHIRALQRCAERASMAIGMEKPAGLLNSTIDQLVMLRNCQTWDDVHDHMDIDYGRLTFSKQCTDTVLAEQIKTVREACKKGLAGKLRKFAGDSKQILSDMNGSMCAVRGLISLTFKFADAYAKLKRSRRILDFSDLEHKTLDLLLGKKRTGVTRVAQELGLRFREIMVDEYQDSNAVQDAIFSALTVQRQNCFMVGDVKQSIYQFRLADPGIFLEKYNSFVPAEEARPGEGRKVLLSSNFRSSAGVIKAVNDVFSVCMSPEIGGLVYGCEEQLHEGVEHVPLSDPEVELYGIDVSEDTYAEESSFVAEKIAELLDGSHMIRSGSDLRPVTPDDIVILLRSPGSVGGEFQYALEKRGIRCTTGGSQDLLQTEEIEVLRSLLQVISNPLQDIPLIAVLTSRVFGFTADDLAAFRSKRRSGSIYGALQADGTEKTAAFLHILNVLRREAQMNSLAGLLNRIFTLTRIDSIFAALPDGAMRLENLQSFCQIAASYESAGVSSLSRFLEHLAAMEERGLAAPGEQSSSGAVTIMSIHKSKGLEYPVVFLCCLSRDFNRESTRAQVLCDKELGLGLTCVDMTNRVRYPTIAKRAITAKMLAESLSEEMRVLYVAMTRARDRLIMTYAARNVEDELTELSLRMGLSDTLLLTGDTDCPGLWVLLTALKHREDGWSVNIVHAPASEASVMQEERVDSGMPDNAAERLRESLTFCYAYLPATTVPSKQTATQLKGRDKDREVAEDAEEERKPTRNWRAPSFVKTPTEGRTYGTAMHAVMQHIRYAACMDLHGVECEVKRLVEEGYISEEQGSMVSTEQIADFFASDVGRRLCNSRDILREFKFSILDDASRCNPDVTGEMILLQGVIDCAIIEDDGITVIDFKSDHVTEDTIRLTADRYTPQILAYADALTRIYQMPVKSAMLYFFGMNRFVELM